LERVRYPSTEEQPKYPEEVLKDFNEPEEK
jgi:hypothetical protein